MCVCVLSDVSGNIFYGRTGFKSVFQNDGYFTCFREKQTHVTPVLFCLWVSHLFHGLVKVLAAPNTGLLHSWGHGSTIHLET